MNDVDRLITKVGEVVCNKTATRALAGLRTQADELLDAWNEIDRLARLGAAVEAMPKESSIKSVSQISPLESRWVGSYYPNPIDKHYVRGDSAQEVLDKLRQLGVDRTT